MRKSEVYSWRLTPELKARLENAARVEEVSVSRLLEEIVEEWLEEHRPGAGDEERQRRLQRVATTAAVLAELFHLLGDSDREATAAWRLLRTDAITVPPIGDSDLPDLDRLMARYRDRPMDFADATLVRLAEREDLVDILTVDHDDFETYRIGGRKRFRIVPSRESIGP